MKASLILFKKNGNTKSFPVSSAVTVIGRRQDCDLCIPLMVISRKHCELNQDQGQFKIRDLGSRNGTFVNGTQIKESELNPGDKVNIGPLSFAVQIDGVPTSDAILQPPTNVEKQEDLFLEDAQDFADMTGMEDLDLSGPAGPGQSSTEFFNDVAEEIKGDGELPG
jgi:pSer/pThr/pTyr-binding forkhead associated (FHA) protein